MNITVTIKHQILPDGKVKMSVYTDCPSKVFLSGIIRAALLMTDKDVIEAEIKTINDEEPSTEL